MCIVCGVFGGFLRMMCEVWLCVGVVWKGMCVVCHQVCSVCVLCVFCVFCVFCEWDVLVVSCVRCVMLKYHVEVAVIVC